MTASSEERTTPQAMCEIPAGSILHYRGIPVLIESATKVVGTPKEIADIVLAIQDSHLTDSLRQVAREPIAQGASTTGPGGEGTRSNEQDSEGESA